MKFKVFAGLKICALIFFISCGGKEDTDFPEIISVEEPHDLATVNAADGLRIHVKAKDNRGLSQVKIELVPYLDTNAYSAYTDKLFLKSKYVYNTSGTNYDSTISIALPADVATFPYKLHISATDASGNLSPVFTRNFLIKNSIDPEPPTVTVTSPASGSVYPVNNWMSVHVLLNDNVGLSICQIRLRKGNVMFYASDAFLSFQVSGEVHLDIPPSAPGNFILEVEGFDMALNHTLVQVPVVFE